VWQCDDLDDEEVVVRQAVTGGSFDYDVGITSHGKNKDLLTPDFTFYNDT
jgi:hypothetical protein